MAFTMEKPLVAVMNGEERPMRICEKVQAIQKTAEGVRHDMTRLRETMLGGGAEPEAEQDAPRCIDEDLDQIMMSLRRLRRDLDALVEQL